MQKKSKTVHSLCTSKVKKEQPTGVGAGMYRSSHTSPSSGTGKRVKGRSTHGRHGLVHSPAAAAHPPYKKFSSRYANRTLLP